MHISTYFSTVLIYNSFMGFTRSYNRSLRNARAKTRAYKLSREIQTFYASHFVSKWQRDRVDDIRKLYEEREKDLALAHDHACSRVSEEFMQLELDYLMTSNSFKEKPENVGQEMTWSPGAGMGIMARAFLKNMVTRAKSLGLDWHGEKTT